MSDPYIRARHQLLNLVIFSELAGKKCCRLKAISLTTGREPQREVRHVISASWDYMLIINGWAFIQADS